MRVLHVLLCFGMLVARSRADVPAGEYHVVGGASAEVRASVMSPMGRCGDKEARYLLRTAGRIQSIVVASDGGISMLVARTEDLTKVDLVEAPRTLVTANKRYGFWDWPEAVVVVVLDGKHVTIEIIKRSEQSLYARWVTACHERWVGTVTKVGTP